MTDTTVKGDTEFAALARQLQDKWRVKNNFPIGSYKNAKGELIPLGNYIERDFAFKTGANFLTPKIFGAVKKSLLNKELGAKIEKTRLFTNLLSSQPLAFNLFAELALDLKLATNFFVDLFSDRVMEVTEIIFEHSSGRGDYDYTGDHSAFDVFVSYNSIKGKPGFIGIEVKYSENLIDKPSTHKDRYKELTESSKLFKKGSLDLLKQRPIQQIWRDHLLSIAHLNHKNGNYEEGFFIYLFPKKNKECQDGVNKYITLFESFDQNTKKYDERLTGFYIRYLDDFMIKLRHLTGQNWTKDLIDRYLGDN